MPVWVRIRLRRPGQVREVEASAKVNTGFTVGPLPVVRLPDALAERLGFDIERGEILRGVVDAAGRPLPMLRLGQVEVMAIEPDRRSRWVRAIAVRTGAQSVLLNDYLTEELEIEPAMPGSGFWRFRGEDRLRKSAEPEYYGSQSQRGDSHVKEISSPSPLGPCCLVASMVPASHISVVERPNSEISRCVEGS